MLLRLIRKWYANTLPTKYSSYKYIYKYLQEPLIDYEEQPEPDELLANTNLVRSSQGLVKATSAFDTEPGIEQQQETYARRSHSYKKLTVLHSANCLSCRQRLKTFPSSPFTFLHVIQSEQDTVRQSGTQVRRLRRSVPSRL